MKSDGFIFGSKKLKVEDSSSALLNKFSDERESPNSRM